MGKIQTVIGNEGFGGDIPPALAERLSDY